MTYVLIAYIGRDIFVGRMRFGYEECLHEALMATWRVGIEFNCMLVM